MIPTRIHIAKIEKDRYTDGPGPRTVVWMQGCSIRCPGCQNKELWDQTGRGIDVYDAARAVLTVAGDQPITITGGEPFDQPDALYALLEAIRAHDDNYRPEGRRHVIVYTGYTWSTLASRFDANKWIRGCLTYNLIDILVDGPYIAHLDTDLMQWRGSSNQRPILMRESVEVGALLVYQHLVLADWDTPTIEIDGDTTIMAGGLAELLGENAHEIARCGERNGE